jgi:hypothetical protein
MVEQLTPNLPSTITERSHKLDKTNKYTNEE